MFGRFRPPPSSPDCLETCPTKIIKHDPLSVYESTLLKLKQGSRLNLGPCLETSSETEGEHVSSPESVECSDPSICSDAQHSHGHGHDPMATDSVSGDAESGKSSKQQKNTNPVLHMFSRYKDMVRT